MINIKDESPEAIKMIKSNILKCYLNISVCFIKLNDFHNAMLSSNESINIDPNNVKALYRRAISRVKLNHFDPLEIKLSILDLKHASKLEMNNDEINNLLFQYKKMYLELKKAGNIQEKKPKKNSILPKEENVKKENFIQKEEIKKNIPEKASSNLNQNKNQEMQQSGGYQSIPELERLQE